METYVVRVYRQMDEDGDEILGVVEIIGGQDKKAFKSVDEMVEIITGAEGRQKIKQRDSATT